MTFLPQLRVGDSGEMVGLLKLSGERACCFRQSCSQRFARLLGLAEDEGGFSIRTNMSVYAYENEKKTNEKYK